MPQLVSPFNDPTLSMRQNLVPHPSIAEKNIRPEKKPLLTTDSTGVNQEWGRRQRRNHLPRVLSPSKQHQNAPFLAQKFSLEPAKDKQRTSVTGNRFVPIWSSYDHEQSRERVKDDACERSSQAWLSQVRLDLGLNPKRLYPSICHVPS